SQAFGPSNSCRSAVYTIMVYVITSPVQMRTRPSVVGSAAVNQKRSQAATMRLSNDGPDVGAEGVGSMSGIYSSTSDDSGEEARFLFQVGRHLHGLALAVDKGVV